MKKILIGFDADTDRCGFVAYNCETKNYIFALNADYNTLAVKTIPRLYRSFKGYSFDCFIEIPTFRTIFSLAPKNNNYDLAKSVFRGARCAEVALQFKDLCQKFGFMVETVKSENRVRPDRKEYERLTCDEIKTTSKLLARQGKYFSKMDYNKSVAMFDFSILNSEVTDAALLILPKIVS